MSKKQRRADARQKRIQEMKAREAKIRAIIDKGHQLGKQWQEATHYDQLVRQRAGAAASGTQAVKDDLDRGRELVAQCFHENMGLVLECERLKRRLHTLEGHPPPPLWENEILKMMPPATPEQVRLVLLAQDATPPQAEWPEAFPIALSFIAQATETLTALRSDTEDVLQLVDLIDARGWAPKDRRRPTREQAEPVLAAMEAELDRLRTFLQKAQDERPPTLEERASLLRAIADLEEKLK
jgi:hypothetical protein